MTIRKGLIINCDDFGQSKAANQAIMQLLEENKVSSATIMVPAPGFEEAAQWCAKRRQPNVGLHLTFNSEALHLRWKSITEHPSLHDEQGYLHENVEQFERKAATQAVVKEMEAQYERALKHGMRLSHVDNHMGSLYGMAAGRSHIPHMLWKARRWKLPARLFRYIDHTDPLLSTIPNLEQPVRKASALADTLGVPIPDYLLSHPYHVQEQETYDSFKAWTLSRLYRLPEGISETYFHPGTDDPWMQAHIPSWEKRVWEHRLLMDEDFAYTMQDAGVELTSYRYVEKHLKRPRFRAALQLFFPNK